MRPAQAGSNGIKRFQAVGGIGGTRGLSTKFSPDSAAQGSPDAVPRPAWPQDLMLPVPLLRPAPDTGPARHGPAIPLPGGSGFARSLGAWRRQPWAGVGDDRHVGCCRLFHHRAVNPRNLVEFQGSYHRKVADSGRLGFWMRGLAGLLGELLLGHGPSVQDGGTLCQGDLLGEDFRVHGFRIVRRDVLHLGNLVPGLFGDEGTCRESLLHGHSVGEPALGFAWAAPAAACLPCG